MAVEQLRVSVFTRTDEFTPRELPPPEPVARPRRTVRRETNGASQRIREALRRWFEEEL